MLDECEPAKDATQERADCRLAGGVVDKSSPIETCYEGVGLSDIEG